MKMSPWARLVLVFTGLLHVGFGILEMVLWQTEIGMSVFGTSPEEAEMMAALALNQGVYNLFIAAGLFWAAGGCRRDVALFFGTCVVVAGAVGGLTVSPRIMLVQGVPGALCVLFALFSRKAAKA